MDICAQCRFAAHGINVHNVHNRCAASVSLFAVCAMWRWTIRHRRNTQGGKVSTIHRDSARPRSPAPGTGTGYTFSVVTKRRQFFVNF